MEGAWRYLHSFEGIGVDVTEAPSTPPSAPAIVVDRDGLVARAVAVPHGMMPAVAYRIDYRGASLVYSGDVSGREPGFVDLARGCVLLVHDQAVPEREVRESHLHTRPSVTAAVAREVGCRTLLLTHIMPELEDELDGVLAPVRATYRGELLLGHDLMTVSVSAG